MTTSHLDPAADEYVSQVWEQLRSRERVELVPPVIQTFQVEHERVVPAADPVEQERERQWRERQDRLDQERMFSRQPFQSTQSPIHYKKTPSDDVAYEMKRKALREDALVMQQNVDKHTYIKKLVIKLIGTDDLVRVTRAMTIFFNAIYSGANAVNAAALVDGDSQKPLSLNDTEEDIMLRVSDICNNYKYKVQIVNDHISSTFITMQLAALIIGYTRD